MTKKTKRRQIREVIASSILDKRFHTVFPSSRRISMRRVHPLAVIADLRNGCLSSLERYLAQNRGIVDREIALELRKLIAGSQYRSHFRLVVIDHPHKPKSKGGRPRKTPAAATAKERSLVAEFESPRKIDGKNYLAKEVLAKPGKVSASTINRARRNVKQSDLGQLYT